ncbi:hypothetical protein PCANC_24642 [Puccinia coronata f. sp. avenae]|uniref:Uncharacterized protein n=1 Tax=Puccinia coronata f. sp. avenae TaxID=200324 RepID=A0A2N5U4I5_9BASI|nr:hypothetical protein PCANC_24642 [Puccinia coronata f. sp. avenae]
MDNRSAHSAGQSKSTNNEHVHERNQEHKQGQEYTGTTNHSNCAGTNNINTGDSLPHPHHIGNNGVGMGRFVSLAVHSNPPGPPSAAAAALLTLRPPPRACLPL